MSENKKQTTTGGRTNLSVETLLNGESIINRSPVVHCLWRLGGNWPVEYISNNVTQWGYTPDDFLSGRVSWQVITHPDDAARVASEVISHIRNKTPHFAQSYRIRTGEGDWRWVEDQNVFVPGPDGIITHLQGSVLDVTDRKQAEQAFRESEERLHELLARSSDLIVLIDAGGVFSYVSPSVKPLMGYEQEDLLGRNAFDLIHPDDIPAVRKGLGEVTLKQNRGVPREFRFRRADGTWIHLEALGNNCLDNPAVRGIIINARDISERKKLASQLLHAQKMEAIGKLAGGIAHDFNNILMGIQGYVSLLLLKMDTIHPDFEKLLNIQTLVQSGADLTGKLLGFARGGHFELKPTNLNTLIAKSVNLFCRTKKDISVHQKYADPLWTVEVDRVQIEQVILNLFVNAWQAMPQGGGITISTQNITVPTSSRGRNIKAGRYVSVTIADTGVGMTEETRLHIFEPFFSTKEIGRGVGLGLASAYGIVREHQGVIEVTSAPGEGTQFTILLPASDKAIPEETYADKTIFKGTETLLLIDDEPSILEVCKDILVSLGYTVHTAGSGAEAIDIYLSRHAGIDLIVLDMIMPNMSGAQTFDALRRIDPDARVILSTGYSASEKADSLLEKGCRGIIAKPFRIDELSQKIRSVLDQT